jgi:orotidine-5'-phosphate decarboxylase
MDEAKLAELLARTRRSLALALDLDDLGEARALARRLAPYFSVVKVGLQIFSSAGPEAVAALAADGFDVFLDVKLYDIPTTVGRAARALARLGPAYVTVHGVGGEAMLRAAVEGLAEGTAAAAAPPVALAVTVLTSDPPSPGTSALVAERAVAAQRAGCGGVVCAAADIPVVDEAAAGLLKVVPGVRMPGAAADDQARTATPAEALAAGATLVVVGRTVTGAPDPQAAAGELARTLTEGTG